MKRQKIGNLKDIIAKNSELVNIILRGVFEDNISLGGKVDNLQKYFLIDISDKVSVVMIKSLSEKRLEISLSTLKENATKSPSGQPMNTIHTFVLHYLEEGFPIYNSRFL